MQTPLQMPSRCNAKRRTTTCKNKTRLLVVRTTTSIPATQTKWTKWSWNKRSIMCSTSQAALCKRLISKTSFTNSSTRATVTSQISNSHWTTRIRCINWSEWCVSRTTQAPVLAPRVSLSCEAAILMQCSKCSILRSNSNYQTVLLRCWTTLERATRCTSLLVRTMWPFSSTRTTAMLWVGLDPVVRLEAKTSLSQEGRWCLFDKVYLITWDTHSKIVPGVLSFFLFFFEILSWPFSAIWRVFITR